MKRREFVKSTAAAVSLPFWLQGCRFLDAGQYPVYFRSDYETGHLMLQGQQWEKEEAGAVETIIVGGGMAGMAAAVGLGPADFKLFELSGRLGGTSACEQYQGLQFSQGAHYELAYPEYYGEEVLSLFEKLKIIRYEPWKKMWSFEDQQHIIPFQRRQQCFENGMLRPDVIPEGSQKERFYQHLNRYLGEMHLPTRLIPEKNRHLNDLTFFDFLTEHSEVDPQFQRQLDYHMMDDWGGPSNQVSALAGIHYFMCRPYLTKSVDLFSPPNGNFYFLDKMKSVVTDEKLITNHLVSKIEKNKDEFLVEVLDVSRKKKKSFKCEKVIYAGQKHALKYVYRQEAHLFNQVQAPWMILNFVCEAEEGKYGFWQNEFLGENRSFLGFIDSSVQDRRAQKSKRVLTAYYCLEPKDREYLATIEASSKKIAAETLDYITEMLDEKIEVEACFVNVMGHAMSIPVPGFLFNDANEKGTDLIYAGVDNGRLPLLFEAVDSGLMAASVLSS